MITVFSNNKEIPVNKVEFSDGAVTFCLEELPDNPKYISINVCPSTPVKDVREEVDLIVSSIENFYGAIELCGLGFPVKLNLPYLCYGRADRVFEKGNPSPLYDFLTWLRLKRFSQVNVCDVHNHQTLKGFNINNKTQLQCFKESIPYDFNEEYDYVIAPDKGAMDKARTIAEHLETNIIYAGKKRDISTGRIQETTLPEDIDLKGAKVLIPDDLCDYGGTFLQLAKQLKEVGVVEVHLYVTHLICAGGLSRFEGLIDKIYYYHVVGSYINNEDIMRYNHGR